MVHIGEGSVVCATAILEGDVSIGHRTIVHPLARIIAKTGPIVIGDNNIIEEKVEIINDSPGEKVMIIGSGNVFQASCSVRSLKIGNNNVMESGSHLGLHTVLPYGNVITAGCRVEVKEVLPELAILYSLAGCEERRLGTGPPPDTEQEVELLAKLLPNYHQLLPTDKTSGAQTDRADHSQEIKPSSSTASLSSTAKSFVRFKSLLHSNTSLRRNK